MLTRLEPMVSIIIKALNEERHIAATIESALAALAGIDGEVILADAASTDRTVEIAERYPIQIVRLGRIEDRSCGAGAQLGYQYSRGEYLCLIDGDMRLHRGFIQAAVQFLRDNPAVGAAPACIPAAGRWRGSTSPQSTITAMAGAPGGCCCAAS
jgi:glycosyltransferase involved in cell wall biosynthesis